MKQIKQAPLKYKSTDLEPHIDKETMEEHHGVHHKAYATNFNKISSELPSDAKFIEVIQNLKSKNPHNFTIEQQSILLKHGGGHFNHSLYFQMMNKPKIEEKLEICELIKKHWDSISNFKSEFIEKSMKTFASAWTWLVYVKKDVKINLNQEYAYLDIENAQSKGCELKEGSLVILTTRNQESPMMFSTNLTPLICCDLWEHAYYLKHKAKKTNYLDDWFKVLDWGVVNTVYLKTVKESKVIDVNEEGMISFE